MAMEGDHLRAAEVEVHCVTAVLHQPCRCEQLRRIVSSEVRDERSILRRGLELLRAVLSVYGEARGVDHRGVGQVAPVASAEETECQLRTADHCKFR